ncbi:MAG TPA: hypothetical protein VEZ41_15510 [Allosphingosinicella sp.]|nr:hypothetical protein [Allosphingosinicella sp.]
MATQVASSIVDYRTDPLWLSLAEMRVEPPGAALTFTARLARDQRWSRRHAEAVMEEYRRFIFLAATGSRPVTPSRDVDEAWHLHLTYSRHYWDELCGRILGRPLHHDPTEGGAAQQAHFFDQYAATLARYEAVFGEPPRPDIWPSPAIRFGRPEPRRWPRLAAAGSISLAAAGCTALAGASAGGGTVAIVLVIGMLVLLVGVLSSAVVRGASQKRKKDEGDGGGATTTSSSTGNRDGKDTDSADSGDGGDGGGGCGGGCGGS